MIHPVNDSVPLMRQLARMASISEGRIRRMVLVLEIGEIPKLYTEGFLTNEEALRDTELLVEERSIVVSTTTMQNNQFETKSSNERKE